MRIFSESARAIERKVLRALLGINGVMFVAVALAGYWGDSTALLADSLDNLADASVFGIALFTVGRTRRLKANVAILSGILLVALGSSISGAIRMKTGRWFWISIRTYCLLTAFSQTPRR